MTPSEKSEMGEVEEYNSYLKEKLDMLRDNYEALQEEIKELKNESVISCENKDDYYSTLAHYYYHDDFSLQKFFDKIGKKSVEAEFYKFMNRQ